MTTPAPLWRSQPPIVYVLVGAIVLAHLARLLAPIEAGAIAIDLLAIIPARFDSGNEYAFASPLLWPLPLLGHVFLHADFLHLLFNSLILFGLSGPVIARIGAGRYLALLAAAAVCGALVHIGLNPGSLTPAFGASSAGCGLIIAHLAAQYPSLRAALAAGRFWQGVMWLGLVFVGLAALARTAGLLAIGWEAHLGGMIGALGALALWGGGAAIRSR